MRTLHPAELNNIAGAGLPLYTDSNGKLWLVVTDQDGNTVYLPY